MFIFKLWVAAALVVCCVLPALGEIRSGDPDPNGWKTGTVKWWNPTKGLGYIEPDDGSKDVFVFYQVLWGDGVRNLYEGQRVEFKSDQDNKGQTATAVRGPGNTQLSNAIDY